MENIVFYFSGTGNCLKVAKTIVNDLGSGEIVSMARQDNYALKKQYDTIGFVYPTYFWGLPKKIIEFVEALNIATKQNAYYYSIATFGGIPGNAVCQLYDLLLKKHNIKLSYGQKLKMFANYVVAYDMSEKVEKITKKSNAKLSPIIAAIKNRKKNRINKLTRIFGSLNRDFVKNVSGMDRDFVVNNNCTGCGICREVCPVKNIEMENNRPLFKHNCEQCVACIQFCPQRSIDYKDQTQKRGRYTHPEISYKEISERNNL